MLYDICSEMVSTIIDIAVEQGALVMGGDTVALLESMKMEIPLVTEISGTVTSIAVTVGTVVQADEVVMTLDTSRNS